MKAEAVKEPVVEKFEPKTIKITFENIEEMKKFYCIMNYIKISDWIGSDITACIRKVLRELDPRSQNNQSLFNDFLKTFR